MSDEDVTVGAGDATQIQAVASLDKSEAAAEAPVVEQSFPPKPDEGEWVRELLIEDASGTPMVLALPEWRAARMRSHVVGGQLYEACAVVGDDWVYRAMAF